MSNTFIEASAKKYMESYDKIQAKRKEYSKERLDLMSKDPTIDNLARIEELSRYEISYLYCCITLESSLSVYYTVLKDSCEDKTLLTNLKSIHNIVGQFEKANPIDYETGDITSVFKTATNKFIQDHKKEINEQYSRPTTD